MFLVLFAVSSCRGMYVDTRGTLARRIQLIGSGAASIRLTSNSLVISFFPCHVVNRPSVLPIHALLCRRHYQNSNSKIFIGQ